MDYSCTPIAWYSSNFLLQGTDHSALLAFNWFGEQGTITIDGVECRIRKQGLFSPQWTLEVQNQSIAIAKRSGMFTQGFQIEGPQGIMTLNPVSIISRNYCIRSGQEVLATLAPTGIFTRSLSIEVPDSGLVTDLPDDNESENFRQPADPQSTAQQLLTDRLDFTILSFACWLLLLIRRRAQSHNSHS